MKPLRYIIIAVLLYSIATSIYSYVYPTLIVSDGTQPDASTTTAIISHYRMLLLPWILLNGIILAGWLFSSRRGFAYGVLIIATPLLAYLSFINVRKLGYTLEQSLQALSQGHGGAITNWMILGFVTLVALPFFAQSKVKRGDTAIN